MREDLGLSPAYPARLVFDENILGRVNQLLPDGPLNGAICPHLSQRLAVMAQLCRPGPVEICLSIRSMDRFLPSAHAEAMRRTPPVRGFDVVRADIKASAPPHWRDVVARLERAMPQARIRSWRDEDYRDNTAAITARVIGHDPGPLPKIAPPPGTMTPSAEAAAEALDRGTPLPDWRTAVDRIYAARPAGHPARPVMPPSPLRRPPCCAPPCCAPPMPPTAPRSPIAAA